MIILNLIISKSELPLVKITDSRKSKIIKQMVKESNNDEEQWNFKPKYRLNNEKKGDDK